MTIMNRCVCRRHFVNLSCTFILNISSWAYFTTWKNLLNKTQKTEVWMLAWSKKIRLLRIVLLLRHDTNMNGPSFSCARWDDEQSRMKKWRQWASSYSSCGKNTLYWRKSLEFQTMEKAYDLKRDILFDFV